MEIMLIRHEMTKGNQEKRYVGRTDEPLLSFAVEKLKQTRLSFVPDLVYASPLKRCVQTAELLFPLAEVCVKDNLRETDFGRFEYKNYEELKDEPAYQAWIDSGGLTAFPDGESGADFRDRCLDAFTECLRDAKEKHAASIAIVTHGGVIMSILSVYGRPKADFYAWQLKNGEMYLLSIDG